MKKQTLLPLNGSKHLFKNSSFDIITCKNYSADECLIERLKLYQLYSQYFMADVRNLWNSSKRIPGVDKVILNSADVPLWLTALHKKLYILIITLVGIMDYFNYILWLWLNKNKKSKQIVQNHVNSAQTRILVLVLKTFFIEGKKEWWKYLLGILYQIKYYFNLSISA